MSGVNPLDPTNLPAHVYFYGPFKTDAQECKADTEQSSIQITLNSCCGHGKVGELDHKIKNALCFVSGLKPYKNYKLHIWRWHFLYYWIGEQIWTALDGKDTDGKVAGCLKQICELINDKCGSGGDEGECKILCSENLDGETFTSRKNFFDFTQNYNDIKDYLQQGKPECATYWSTYKKNIEAACTAVRDYCKKDGEHSADPYCVKFRDTYEIYCTGAMLPGLKCMLKTELDEIRCHDCPCHSEQSQITELLNEHNDAVRQANTTTALSSIIGTLGFTVAPFLLYKYKPWSSWFGNRSSGNGVGRSNRRKRRSTGHHFDASTEDTLTEISTDNSTIADATIDGTVSSAAHARPSTRNGRTNNTRGRGMVGYQNV
ncbi:KIR-like protein [Plasmodium coatneyi]|uniref:KIR-like protein n=1 Tax=Plasmodium coatneyi TaxID=208452 RepID=A0A1B1E0G4_9APIC|nr:KIR-like protein [Plasmodium coatneyi]ANQ08524.1 KIR-like protein [Plasmodium coatneyi]